jgi:hypothetical protein
MCGGANFCRLVCVLQVRGYDTRTSTLRVSLVLEQYLLRDDDERYLVEYSQSEATNGMML